MPTKGDYQLFRGAHVALLSNLFASGVQDFTVISDTCRVDFESVFHGEDPPICEKLLEASGSIHMPKGKAPVLAVFPSEHASHITWQVPRLKEQTRHTARRLHCTPPHSSVPHPPLVSLSLHLIFY